MKKIIVLFLLIAFKAMVFAQTSPRAPRMVKTPVSNSGCYAYFPKAEAELKFELSYSEDSAKVYTGEVVDGVHHFAVIVVKMNQKLSGKEEKENMLIGYLDYLKTSFEVKNAAGYGKGHQLESAPNSVGVIDYWVDADANKWAIKGWTDENILAVMMLYGPEDYPIFNVQKMFLDGFRFK
jgi:hypothetical protein